MLPHFKVALICFEKFTLVWKCEHFLGFERKSVPELMSAHNLHIVSKRSGQSYALLWHKLAERSFPKDCVKLLFFSPQKLNIYFFTPEELFLWSLYLSVNF